MNSLLSGGSLDGGMLCALRAASLRNVDAMNWFPRSHTVVSTKENRAHSMGVRLVVRRAQYDEFRSVDNVNTWASDSVEYRPDRTDFSTYYPQARCGFWGFCVLTLSRAGSGART